MAQFFNSRCLFRHLLFHFNLFEVQCKGGLWTKDLSPLQFLCKKSSPEKTVHYSRIRTQTVGIEGEHAVHSNGLNCVTCNFFKKWAFLLIFVFSNKHCDTTSKCEKMSMCSELNPRPSVHDCPPINTPARALQSLNNNLTKFHWNNFEGPVMLNFFSETNSMFLNCCIKYQRSF